MAFIMKRWQYVLLSGTGVSLFVGVYVLVIYSTRSPPKKKEKEKSIDTKSSDVLTSGNRIKTDTARNNSNEDDTIQDGDSCTAIVDSSSLSTIISSVDSSSLSFTCREDSSSTNCSGSASESDTGSTREKGSIFGHPLTDEEFQDCLTSPIVRELEVSDARMPRGHVRKQHGAANDIVVVEYDSEQSSTEMKMTSVVDDTFHNIYDSYHDVVPPLQPNTHPVVFR